ncbi:MAG TPA: hypothetical protein VFP06_03460, partial [Acidimicrobiales bacterium]|nr:hypothetical protein [Acidimicrobiales bacterium]
MGDDGFEPAAFARDYQRFVAGINRLVPPRPSPVRELITDHLGHHPDDLPVLSESLESAEHPNLQLALDDLVKLPDPACRHRLFELHLRVLPGLGDIDLAPLVAATDGVSA